MISDRPRIAYLSFSISRIRLSPLIVLMTRRGPEFNGKARQNASIRPRGFFLSSTLRKSKLNRNMNSAGRLSWDREIDGSTDGVKMGNRYLKTGLGETLRNVSRMNSLAN